MKISTKGRYALRMLVDLAENDSGGYIALKDIARRQGISKKYLEQIVPVLNRSDILLTNRGFQGGYRLAKSPDKYTVGDILRLTEGSLAPVACLDSDPVLCDKSETCPTLPVWKGLEKVINDYLDSITLQDILDREASNYVI
ncbi:MAG: Rrf2 family transcriptional regulator [Clostridia bacterium]|nr:Rrf2 family transcriptional regulator [Clostridia bacterium]